MADNTASEDASVTFSVKSSSGPKVTVTLPLTTTVADLKNKLAEPDMANVPAASQRLIYSGKVLKDHETLATNNVKEGNTMHLVRSAASNQRQNPATQSTPTSTTSNQQNAPPAGVPQNFASGTGNDPLIGLTGARYAGYPGMPSLESLAHPPSADDIARRLEDPNFAQQMNEALSNPQMIDMMINMNPQLRAMGPQMRQMLQSEGFRRMMTNPDSMRGMMEMQRAMGNDPFGGAGGQGAFAMPGATSTTDSQHQNQGQGQGQDQAQQQQQNPLASMFGGAGGMNPLMFMPPPAGGDRSADPSANQANQANPFAAMFNPAMFGQQQGQATGHTNNNASTNPTTGAESTNPSSPPPNPFANNPMLSGMMNNPMVQQMMNNPEAMRQAMQMMMGGGGGGGMGGMGGLDPFAALGGAGGASGFGQPADNRPPEERFATQLRQLNEMGFFNYDQNIQALSRSGGDVNGALEWLFSQPPS